MSSESRSNSAVRNLRSIFENKASEQTTPDSRGRSPNGINGGGGSDKENNYNSQQPRSKVRASFVAVEPAPSMAASIENASGRRGSFGEADGDLELRKTISDQQDELGVPEGAIESMPPSVAATPLKPPNFGQLGHDISPATIGAEKESENPDKPVTGAEEEAGDMKPADPANEDAVSGGDALPPVAEDLTSTAKPTPASSSKTAKKAESKTTPTSTSRPTAISTKAAPKPAASNSVKSPTTQPKTPVSGKTPSSSIQSPIIAKKTSRSSLTAPTAASMARASGASEAASSTTDKSKTSPQLAKVKPREVTKPVNLSSHLTAPTASSKAKHDPSSESGSSGVGGSASATASFRTSLASRPPAKAATKPAARASLAGAGHRPQSRDSATSARRSLAAHPPVVVDGSFLERMMRPTAASSGHRHEKIVTNAAKSPPAKTKPAAKPKANGHPPKPAAATTDTSTGLAAVAPAGGASLGATSSHEALHEEAAAEADLDAAGISLAGGATTIGDAMAAADDQAAASNGNETPNHSSIEHANAGLEATPAGLGGEETIR